MSYVEGRHCVRCGEPEESARYQQALRDKRRAETFLRIARESAN